MRFEPVPILLVLIAQLALAPKIVHAQKNDSINVEVVARGLHNPCAVAICPNSNGVFVSESGAGRVLRLQHGKLQEFLTGFPTEVYGNRPGYRIGPLGLLFLNESTLLVGEGGRPAGKDRILAFRVTDARNQKVDAAISSAEMLGSESPDAINLEGNFYGLAMINNRVFATAHGDDTEGWITAADWQENQLTNLRKQISTKSANAHAPTAMISNLAGNLLVSQFGETNIRHDAAIAEFTPQGRLEAVYYCGLNDITGLAMHPKSGRLYAVDFSWIDERQAGLFELKNFDPKRKRCDATKICDLFHPTALAFDANGIMWVTDASGPATPGSELRGRLIKITLN